MNTDSDGLHSYWKDLVKFNVSVTLSQLVICVFPDRSNYSRSGSITAEESCVPLLHFPWNPFPKAAPKSLSALRTILNESLDVLEEVRDSKNPFHCTGALNNYRSPTMRPTRVVS